MKTIQLTDEQIQCCITALWSSKAMIMCDKPGLTPDEEATYFFLIEETQTNLKLALERKE